MDGELEQFEESVRDLDPRLLKALLADRSTKGSILWGTADYEGHAEFSEIRAGDVTGAGRELIRRRVSKSRSEQYGRTRGKAEVFTPSWVCNAQNNLVDSAWFGRTGVFNTETGKGWIANPDKIDFSGARGGWKDYVDARRLEMACGEAPYLVSRYDTVTGGRIAVADRIGILDRKLRVVGENAETDEEWAVWARRAFESVYGFEYQGDSLFLARENLLLTYADYYHARSGRVPGVDELLGIAEIISWNLWQMDGLKGVVPGSCREEEEGQLTLDLFGDEPAPARKPCPGCASGDMFRHNGIYCVIRDWRAKRNKAQTYVSALKEGRGK